MKDPVAPSAPPMGVDEDEASKAELLRALKAMADQKAETPLRVSAFVQALADQTPPPIPHRCTRPHIDEMQTWNPAYEPGGGPTN